VLIFLLEINDSLDDMARKQLSQIHPTFMGGEYLPDCGRNEVEIVRIELESTTYDVISLRARPAGSRIAYSLVDSHCPSRHRGARSHCAS
jgi:hypothetical protein